MRYPILSQAERQCIAIQGAGLMVYRDFTLWEISDFIKVPMSTVYKCMMEELPSISEHMYKEVRAVIAKHKTRGGRHPWYV